MATTLQRIQATINDKSSSALISNLQAALLFLDYTISPLERKPKLYGIDTRKAVRAVQLSNRLTEQDGTVGVKTAELLNKLLEERGAFSQEDMLLMSGRIFDEKGAVLSGVSVLVYSMGLKGAKAYRTATKRSELTIAIGFQELSKGTLTTNASGIYQVTFAQPADLLQIVAVAFDADKILGRSAIATKKNVDKTLSLDDVHIVIQSKDNTMRPTDDEFVRLSNQLKIASDTVSLHELKDSEEAVDFLAAETGLDREAVKIQVNAHAIGRELGQIDDYTRLLYALGRQNIDLALDNLALVSDSTLSDAIGRSIADNVVPSVTMQIQSSFLTALRNKAQEALLTKNVALAQTLAVALPESAKQKAFLKETQNFEGDAKDFWTKHLPQKGFSNPQIQSLQLNNQLYILTSGHAPAIKELQQKRQIKALTDLIQYEQADWEALVRITGKPQGYDTEGGYIADMKRRLYAAFPSQKIAQMVDKGKFRLVAENRTVLLEFLKTNADFDITKSDITRLDRQLRQSAGTRYDTVKADLEALQRTFAVSATPDMMTRLWAANLRSAYSIATIPKKHFINRFKEEGLEVAEATYNRALAVTKRSESVALRVQDSAGTTGKLSIMNSKKEKEAIVNVLKSKIPNYETLFGSQKLCECQHCRSMYSPAAYFVDIMRFLEKNEDGVTLNMLNELLRRRPDLQHLELSCENTNTLIPYIDLANEVMEYYVANPAEIHQIASALPYKGYNNHVETPEELRAEPQNTRIGAYRELAETVYPSTLPYHYPLDAMRQYFGAMKTSRFDIISAFQETKALKGFVAKEYLGLSPEEAKILSGEDTRKVWEYYGFKAADTEGGFKTDISKAQELTKRLGITYKELTEILKTRYVNPGQDMLDYISDTFKNIAPNVLYKHLKTLRSGNNAPLADPAIEAALSGRIDKRAFMQKVITEFDAFSNLVTLYETTSACDPDTTLLYTLKGIYEPASGMPSAAETAIDIFKNIHRFVRLQRKYGWSAPDLDALLTALNGGNDLDQLAEAKWLMDTLQLKPAQVAVFWGSMDTHGAHSIYARLFLNRAISKIDAVFEADGLGNFLANSGNKIKEHKAVLQAALKISDIDLSAILEDTALKDAVLTIENVSILYRYALLAKALKIKPFELIQLKAIFDINPFSKWNTATNTFSTATPEKTSDFVRLVQRIKAAGTPIKVLDYVFSATSDDTSGSLALKQEQIDKALENIRKDFADIENAYPQTNALPVSEQLLRQQLGALVDGKDIDHLFGILYNTVQYEVQTDKNLGVNIPNSLKNKLIYDETKGSLAFRGVMKNAEKAATVGLGNVHFQSAIHTLYSIPEEFLSKQAFISPNLKIELLERVEIALILEEKIKAKMDNLSIQYLPYLTNKLQKRSVTQHHSILIGLSESQFEELVGDVPIDLAIEAGKFENYHKAALLINNVRLEAAEIKWFSQQTPWKWDNLKPKNWMDIDDYRLLRQTLPQMSYPFLYLLNFKPHNTDDETLDKFAGLISETTGWHKSLIFDAIKSIITPSVSFDKLPAWQHLIALLRLAEKTDASVSSLKAWSSDETDFTNLHNLSLDIKQTARARYSDEAWQETIGSINDKLRHHQRDALIDYLLQDPTLKTWGITDADGLFEFFLIDVQMGACMETSRIKQAISSVQTFINRCLLNLEKGAKPSDIDRNHWEWMKNYRVWEANRKVLLYPENWLEPEWRDDKSPFFRELEGEITQNDITDATVEQAFRNYLYQLNEVSQLDIVGVYGDKDTQITHVVGRTHSTPYQYYYRTLRLVGEAHRWSAWDKIQVDIRGAEDNENSGVHLVPIVWKKRLFLFWPEFMAKDAGTKENETIPYWEVRLAWTEYQSGKWTPKQLSKEFLETTGFFFKNTIVYRLIPSIVPQSNELTLSLNIPPIIGNSGLQVAVIEIQGVFQLTDIQSKIEVLKLTSTNSVNKYLRKKDDNGIGVSIPDFPTPTPPRPPLTLPSSPTHVEQSEDMYAAWGYANDFSGVRRFDSRLNRSFSLYLKGKSYLAESPTHKLIASSDASDFLNKVETPFFYQDAKRTYYVETGETTYIEYEPFILQQADSVKYLAFENQKISQQTLTAATKQQLALPKMQRANHPQAGNFDRAVNRVEASAFKEVIKYGSAFSSANFEKYVPLRPVAKNGQSLTFYNFFHPYSSDFITELNEGGIPQLMGADLNEADFPSKPDPKLVEKTLSDTESYDPIKIKGLLTSKAKIDIDFENEGAYALYNWELFFHVPLYIATRLSKNGKHAEAMRWFHYIFDPTNDTPNAEGEQENAHYWQVKPFRKEEKDNLKAFLENVDANKIKDWKDNPFKPHLIARQRPIAYMKHVVFKYVENLLAWGDELFRRDTMESINESLQLYIIAAHILGRKPVPMPERGKIAVATYATLRDKLDVMGNAMVALENIFPYSSAVEGNSDTFSGSLLGVGEAFYFCIPNNEKMLQYWDTVADRLFKIRHCQNIEGVERKLALFEPPIDPALLINAVNQGVNINQVLSELNSPMPIYRFVYLAARATELCNEVKSLGGALLSAIEKQDNEALTRLRSTHEIQLLQMTTEIRERAVLEARSNRDGLKTSRQTAINRMTYYLELLGVKDKNVPDLPQLAAQLSADSALPAETTIMEEKPDVDVQLVDGGTSGVKLIPKEAKELTNIYKADIKSQESAKMEFIASFAHYFPDVAAKIPLVGEVIFGGTGLGMAATAYGSYLKWQGLSYSQNAGLAAKMASYIRRDQEWVFQANQAIREIIQTDKQIIAAEIRLQMAEKELDNHRQQIKNAEAIEDFIKTKFTNTELYQWMKEQLFDLHKKTYQLAFDMTKKAEKALVFELGRPLSIVQYDYFDNSYKGLLSGERLHFAIRQLEKIQHEENRREFELTKHISLLQLQPVELLKLKKDGKCTIHLPEWLFDMDFSGHYFRRIKSVSITIPCITGPYSTVNATLRLKNNWIRTSQVAEPYPHNNEEGILIEDDRFLSNTTPVTAIATSSGQNDSGVFELNFRDERYLPFESAGVISEWELELNNKEFAQFDWLTISDVVMHLRYTAKEGSNQLKEAAKTSLANYMTDLSKQLAGQPLARLFDLKHDFPNEWHKVADNKLTITIKKEHFPYFAQGKTINISEMKYYNESNNDEIDKVSPKTIADFSNKVTITITIDKLAGSHFLVVPYQIVIMSDKFKP